MFSSFHVIDEQIKTLIRYICIEDCYLYGIPGLWQRVIHDSMAINPPHLQPILVPFFSVIKSRRLRWASHVARREEGRSVFKILIATGKMFSGRPRQRWEENIRIDLTEIGINTRSWVESAQDRDWWSALISAALKLQVPEAMDIVLCWLISVNFLFIPYKMCYSYWCTVYHIYATNSGKQLVLLVNPITVTDTTEWEQNWEE